MSEILYFEITGFYRANEPLANSSCTFILGSESIDSLIPTDGPIKIETTRLEDTESLLILFKHNDDIVAKTNSSLWSLRNGIGLDFKLESLNTTGFHSTEGHYSWEHSYKILREDNTKIESFTRNPFREQALLGLGSPLREFETKQGPDTLPTLGRDSASLSPLNNMANKTTSFDVQDKLTSTDRGQEENPAEFYLSALEAKLAQSGQFDASLSPDIANLLASLRSSVKQLDKPQAPVHVHNILTTSQRHGSSLEDDYSPKFGKLHHGSPDLSGHGRILHEGSFSNKKEVRSDSKDQAIQQGTSPVKDINTWAVNEEVKENAGENEDPEVNAGEGQYEDDDEDNLLLEEMEGIEEGDTPKPDTMGTIVDEMKIDRNQEYLHEIKSQLGIKALTNISDGFTRELVMQMSRSKKKICAVRLKKSIKLRNKEEIPIETKSYFRDSGDKKFLHFFQPFTKYLFLFNLNRKFDVMDEKPLQVTLDIDFDISPHHKSVITPSGLIFIVSGKAQTAAPDLDDSTGSLHMYHFNGQTLIEKPSMSATRRKQFGLCYMSKNLFVVGGIVDGIISNYCERFDVRSNEWLELAPMNKKLKDISVCSFNSRYIYRYFGVTAMNMTDNSIERYDAVRDKWTLMNVLVPELLREVHMPLCTQINEDTIFIFGGRTSSGYPSKANKGYIMKVEDKRRSNNAELLQTKNFVSGLAGNFSQNSMIAHEGDILFLRESY